MPAGLLLHPAGDGWVSAHSAELQPRGWCNESMSSLASISLSVTTDYGVTERKESQGIRIHSRYPGKFFSAWDTGG